MVESNQKGVVHLRMLMSQFKLTEEEKEWLDEQMLKPEENLDDIIEFIEDV